MLKRQRGTVVHTCIDTHVHVHIETLTYTCTDVFLIKWPLTSRLHREALKQAATDPKTGIIDVGILTTGVSSSERQRRENLANEVRKVLQSRAKGGSSMKYSVVFDIMKEQSQAVS